LKHISISGPVAAGKTTMLKRLLQYYGDKAVAHEERPQDNPFMARYYADSKHWSFHSQIAFLALYFDHPRWAEQEGHEFCFFDRCLIENLVIARYRLENGDLTDEEYAVIEQMAYGIRDLMPPVERYVYLKCSVPLLMEHAHTRGRDYEKGIDRTFAEKQKALYDAWAEELPKDKTLVIDMDQGYDLSDIIRFIES